MKTHREIGNTSLKLKALLLLVIINSIVFNSWAQNVEAFSKIDTNAILIGDQIGMEVGMQIPDGFIVQWPLLVDTLSKNIEIIDKKPIDTISANGELSLLQKLTITSFDSGYFEIPNIEITFQHKDDTTKFTANTNTLFLSVSTPVVDTSQAFKIIKGPVDEPYTLGEILMWVLYAILGLLLILGVVFLIRYNKRRKKNTPFFRKAKPIVPPYELAIRKLEELRLAKVWQQGKLKEYYTDLADISREYFEGRFHFEAMEMTSEQILDELSDQKINKEAISKIASVLQLADLVKFAKAHPAPLENDICLNHCIDFVNETKPVPVVENVQELNSNEQTKIKAS